MRPLAGAPAWASSGVRAEAGRERAGRRGRPGAAGGLGREIALRLARIGYAVRVTDVDGDAARAMAEEIMTDGIGAEGLAAVGSTLDLRDADACRALACEVGAADRGLTLWVNNAGVLASGPVWSHDDETRRLMVEVNTLGTIHGTVGALEVTRPAGRGHVVNIASLAGLAPVPGEGVYAASKHAVVGFSTTAQIDLRLAGHRDVHVSCVCPDGLWTPMLFDRLDDADASMSFSGRLLAPEEVAETVLKVVERPRPVTSVPRWRGAQARAFALAPALAVRLAPLVVAASRQQQRRLGRRLRPQILGGQAR